MELELLPMDECNQCPVEFAVNLIGGKWKLLIIYQLMQKEIIRFNEMQKLLGSVTHRTLTRQLRELEKDGLVNRVTYPEVPPRVEYSLTNKGKSLGPILLQLQKWGVEHM